MTLHFFQADSREKHVKDLAVVLGTETSTIILDDTFSVWPEHQHNLMQVKSRACYLPSVHSHSSTCSCPQCITANRC